MSERAAKALRLTQQIAADRWLTVCRVCPKRLGKRTGATQQALDEWWAAHIQSDMHQRLAASDGSPSAEDQLIARIFGVEPQRKRVTPRGRLGELVSRPHGRPKWHSNDNPRGDTP